MTHMDLQAICQWIQETSTSTALRESAYVLSIIETVHVLALAMAVGTVMWFDLRLLGVSMRRDPVSEVYNQLKPCMFAGFAIMFVTGALLFWSHAAECYASPYFRVKVVLLAVAAMNILLYHSTIDRRRAEWDLAATPPLQARLAGLLSLLLWMGVIAAGRLTAYNL
jgi:hypothetical protein